MDMHVEWDTESFAGIDVYCSICDRNFANQSNFIKHRRQVHNLHEKVITEYTYETTLFKCEECRVSFKRSEYLKLHLSYKHNLNANNYEDLSFSSYQEFQNWLSLEEKANNVEYRQMTGKKKNNTDITIYLQCARSGQVRLISSERKRALKIQGSKKLGRYCTSQILVKLLENGECQVKYYDTHYGHNIELEHLNGPKRGKDPNASKLILGVSGTKILNRFQEDISNKGIHCNVKRKRNIEDYAKLNMLISNPDVCVPSKRDNISEKIKRNLLQTISNIDNDVHSVEHLSYILQKSKKINLLSKIERTAPSNSIAINIKNEPDKKQMLYLSNKRKNNINNNMKANGQEREKAEEILRIEIISDSDSNDQ